MKSLATILRETLVQIDVIKKSHDKIASLAVECRALLGDDPDAAVENVDEEDKWIYLAFVLAACLEAASGELRTARRDLESVLETTRKDTAKALVEKLKVRRP